MTISHYLKRIKQEKFSLRFLLSRLLFRIGLDLPITLHFCLKPKVKTYLYASSASHKLFVGKYRSQLDIHVFKKYLSADSVSIDVGANIGLFSILAAKLSPNGSVYAFEPTAKSYIYLLQNLSLNQIKNVLPFNCAVSDKGGVTGFLEHKYSHEQNRLADTEQVSKTVPVLRLDELLTNFNIHSIDFLKIDVEGSELLVLKSLGVFLEKVQVIYFEANDSNYVEFGYTTKDIAEYLTSNGFQLLMPKLSDGELTTSAYKVKEGQNQTHSNIIAVKTR